MDVFIKRFFTDDLLQDVYNAVNRGLKNEGGYEKKLEVRR